MELKYIFIGAYILMNLLGFSIMGIDKSKARKNHYRISEKTLWIIAVFGGAVGMTIGMKRFRHKTKHIAFKLGFPILAVIEIGLLLYFL